MAPKPRGGSASKADSGAGLPKAGPTKKSNSLSPSRKTKPSPPTKKTKQARNQLVLTVLAFMFPFAFEVYILSKGTNDGYLNGLLCWLSGSNPDGTDVPPSAELDEANVHSCPYRRVPNTANVPLEGDNRFWRRIIVRYPPEGESTPATRQKGLQLISTFFKDPVHSRFPPQNIELVDATDEENPKSLDEYFMDADIKTLMQEDMEEGILNNTFFGTFTDFARKCWKYPFVSPWAMSLGFPAPP